MIRTKGGQAQGVLVDVDHETTNTVPFGQEVSAPFTMMTFEVSGYISVFKVTNGGYIWTVCGSRTQLVGNVRHGAAFIENDPEYYECLICGSYGLHYAAIKKATVNSRRRPEVSDPLSNYARDQL